jgi:triosephosphate isomerase
VRQRFVMGNWKMHGSKAQAAALLKALVADVFLEHQHSCVVFPPTIYLPLVQHILMNSTLVWGSQNVYPADSGAFTGEVSAPMLNDFGCKYVLVGHSERRHLFHEDEKFVAEKFHHVKDHGMIPVLCLGETLEERDQGRTEAVLTKQLLAVSDIRESAFGRCIVAYEPVWAIGTGRTATPEQAQAAHEYIRGLVRGVDKAQALELPIVYGGSVNETNASSIFAMPDVDGGLVGGASLNAKQFVEIVKCINCY